MTPEDTLHQGQLPPLRAAAGPVVCGFSVVAVLVFRLASGPHIIPVDLDVYLMGATAVREHMLLYTQSVHELFFTYPPFAAVIFEPLAGLSLPVAQGLFLSTSVLCYVGAVVVVGRRLGFASWKTALVVVAGTATEPFLRTIVLGQLNMQLLLLVVLDALLMPPRHRGWLVGIAAGIKIVPGIFVLYFLIQRDFKSAGRAMAALAATVAVGVLFAPRDSLTFWSGGFLGLGRFGEAAVLSSDNQSLIAVLMRAMHIANLSAGVGILSCLVGVGCGALAARSLLRHGDEVSALLAVAFGGLIGSPISWTHHWIWVVPLLALFAKRRWWVSTWVVGAVFSIAPMWLFEMGTYRELTFTPTQVLWSAAYLVAALGILARLIWPYRPRQRRNDTQELTVTNPRTQTVSAG